MILETRNLRKSFGGLAVTKDVSIGLRPGETHALIGPNGAGKTTLINLLLGHFSPTSGDILLEGRSIVRLSGHERVRLGVARTFQISTLLSSFTAEKTVMLAILARHGHCFRFGRMSRIPGLRDEARQLLGLVGLSGKEETATTTLSHGDHRQLELALALAARPKVMLLDEPMAGLGGDEAALMVDLLKRLHGQYTILLVEHDMDAVFALADRISVLAEGELVTTGTADDIKANPAVQAAYFGEDHGL